MGYDKDEGLPDRAIELVWNSTYAEVLAKLETVLHGPFRWNIHVVTRRLLLMLRSGQTITPAAVVEQIIAYDGPPNGWVAFDKQKWMGYVPNVAAALRSDNPMSVLHT